MKLRRRTLQLMIRFFSKKNNYKIFYESELDAKKHFLDFNVEFKNVSEEWEYEMPELFELGLNELNKNRNMKKWLESIIDPRNILFADRKIFDNFLVDLNSIINSDEYVINENNHIKQQKLIHIKKQNWNGALWSLADDLRQYKINGDLDTFEECYQKGENEFLHKGNKIKAKSLRNEYHKAKAAGRVD